MAIEDLGGLPARGRLVIDSAPIIYVLENHPAFASRFIPVFERAEAGDYELIVTTMTLAEVLTGPLRQGDESVADGLPQHAHLTSRVARSRPDRRYRASRRPHTGTHRAAAP